MRRSGFGKSGLENTINCRRRATTRADTTTDTSGKGIHRMLPGKRLHDIATILIQLTTRPFSMSIGVGQAILKAHSRTTKNEERLEPLTGDLRIKDASRSRVLGCRISAVVAACGVGDETRSRASCSRATTPCLSDDREHPSRKGR